MWAASERRALLGMDDRAGTWGLIGSMGGAGNAKHTFRGLDAANRAFLRRLKEALAEFQGAKGTDESIDAATACLERMIKEKGISHGVATRLMACARLDVGVSVNGGSARRLGGFAGLPETPASLGKPANYARLLRWVARQPWYTSPKPAEHWQAKLWAMRAALIDCFAYEPS